MFDLRQFATMAPEISSRLKYYDRLESTNDEARKLAEQGTDHGMVVLTEHQTKGRGRRGAAWLSEPGDGLMFSVILRPGFSGDKWGRIGLAAGLGVATALNEVWGLDAQVKWPNDIYLNDRKCAGILVEASGGYVVLGIGINVSGAPASEDVDAQVVALAELAPEPVTREGVLAAVLTRVQQEVDACGDDFANQLDRLRRVFYLSGKNIEFTVGHDCMTGRVRGVSDDGYLVVATPGGDEVFAQASGIRVI